MGTFASTAFLYEDMGDGVRILRCRSLDTIAVVPETIAGKPVLELGTYAFSSDAYVGSEQEGTPAGVWTENEEIVREFPELSGGRLIQLHLPESLKKIGAYAFYNCENLQKLCCYSTTLDWGGGAFTGCNGIRFLDICVKESEKSCLKEILAELRQNIYVTYRGTQEARLIFPEFFEESVENTPARILSTHTHGCGHQYRYCFEQSQFLFREYDGLFPYVQVQESEKLVSELAIGRLRFPLGLSEEHEEIYRDYLTEHRVMAAVYQIQNRNMQQLEWLLKENSYNQKELGRLIKETSRSGDASMMSFLMDAQSRQRNKAERRSFEL